MYQENQKRKRGLAQYVSLLVLLGVWLLGSYAAMAQQRTTPIDTGKVKSKSVTIESDMRKGMVKSQTEIGAKELRRAACCNLSESFETQAAVDVSYSDALTGTKQIRLLGMEGYYSPITTENIPMQRALAGYNGLTTIPGTWLESVQLTKGVGSVLQGYQNLSGSINLELIKAPTAEKLFLNVYADQMGRSEINAHFGKQYNDSLSTVAMVHVTQTGMVNDRNKDGFYDVPLTKAVAFTNRWVYNNNKSYEAQWGINGSVEQRDGGQTNDVHGTWPKFELQNKTTPGLFTMQRQSRQLDAYGKLGIFSQNDSAKSYGNIVHLGYNDLDAYYGNNRYLGRQIGAYYQGLVEKSWGEEWKVQGGPVLLAERVEQQWNDSSFNTIENSAGAAGELTYRGVHDLTVVLGHRSDYHAMWGWMHTPRVHLKYAAPGELYFRFGAGRGYRTPRPYMDYGYLLASNRKVAILENIELEKAWNIGGSISKFWKVGKIEHIVTADAFFTTFDKQYVADVEGSARVVSLYNSTSGNTVKALQGEYELKSKGPISGRVAYKWNEVKQGFASGTRLRPLVPTSRFLATVQWAGKFDKWMVDATYYRYGKARLPYTGDNAEPYQRAEYSDAFGIINLQVTKNWKVWSLYLGTENMLDFRQSDAIVSAENPQSPYFDAGMVWGPLDGRRIYIGARYKIK